MQRAIFRISATVRGIDKLSRRYNEACEGVSELVGSGKVNLKSNITKLRIEMAFAHIQRTVAQDQ